MKRVAKCALLILASLMLLASAATAQVFSETGVSVVLSVGEDQHAIKALMAITDMYGNICQRSENMITVATKEPIYVQLYPSGVKDANLFKIGWTTNTLVNKMQEAKFDSVYGWTFMLSPEDIAQNGFTRALQLSITDRKGKHPWFRVIFKITDLFGAKSLTQYDQILIKTVPREQLDAMGKGPDVTPTIDGLKANQQKTADYISKLESRVSSLEQYIQSIAGSNVASTSPSSSSQTTTFPVNFTGNFAGVALRIVRPDGRTDGFVVKTGSQMVSLPIGKNSFELLVDYGSGQLKQKKPILVEVFDNTRSVNIDLGGAR